MRDLFSQIWLPLAVSGFSCVILLYALWEGLNLADAPEDGRTEAELRVRRVARAGGILLLLAAVLWTAYLRYGPVQELANQIVGD